MLGTPSSSWLSARAFTHLSRSAWFVLQGWLQRRERFHRPACRTARPHAAPPRLELDELADPHLDTGSAVGKAHPRDTKEVGYIYDVEVLPQAAASAHPAGGKPQVRGERRTVTPLPAGQVWARRSSCTCGSGLLQRGGTKNTRYHVAHMRMGYA